MLTVSCTRGRRIRFEWCPLNRRVDASAADVTLSVFSNVRVGRKMLPSPPSYAEGAEPCQPSAFPGTATTADSSSLQLSVTLLPNDEHSGGRLSEPNSNVCTYTSA